MSKETQRKFLLSESDAKKLVGSSKKDIGIVQWYDDNPNDNGELRRIRLVIYKERTGFRHEWIETFKSNTDNSEVRIERERTLDPKKDLNFENLEDMKCVFKIRHVLKSDPEIVIDEFLEIDGMKTKDLNGNDVEFLMEIKKKEKSCNFNEEVKHLGLNNIAMDVTNYKGRFYDNFCLARKYGISLYRIVEFLQNRLLGPVKVISMQGKSLSYNWKNLDEFDSQNLREDPDKTLVLKLGEKKEEKKYEFKDLKKASYSEFYGLSAELDSLFLIEKKGFKIDEVTYITFPDKQKKVEDDGTPKIYKHLKEFTNIFFKCNVSKYHLRYDPNEEQSILNSVKDLWKILEKNFNEEHEVIIDVAGGQKYPSIVASIYCLLNNKSFYYTQNKGILTKFPPVPISWNFNVLDENLSAFKLTKKYGNKKFKYEDYLSLPGFFKDLFDLSGKLGINTPLPLDDIFNKYSEARRMPFGYGQRFIDLINEKKMRKFIIDKITQKWNLMWIGDQIPETVEHSQRHSKRLMEFTVNLINTMGEEAFLKGVPKNLTDEFYFVLGTAMNVHDLGHTALSYVTNNGKKLALNGLPSVVRDLHNELTYQMLTSEKEKYGLLNGIENLENGLKLEKAVALVSRYHRNHMPIDRLRKENKKQYMKIFGLKMIPLVEVVKKEFKGDKDWQELTVVASRWLKFIDGTDVQSDRTIMKEYNNMRTWRTKMEVIALCEELINDSVLWNKQNFSHLKEEIIDIRNLSDNVEKNSHLLEEKAKKIEKTVYDMLEKLIVKGLPNSSQVIVSEHVRKLDKLAFKARQFPHFKKHRIIQAVYPRFYRRRSFEGVENVMYISMDYEKGGGIGGGGIKENLNIVEKVKEDVKKEFKDAGLSEYEIKAVEFD